MILRDCRCGIEWYTKRGCLLDDIKWSSDSIPNWRLTDITSIINEKKGSLFTLFRTLDNDTDFKVISHVASNTNQNWISRSLQQTPMTSIETFFFITHSMFDISLIQVRRHSHTRGGHKFINKILCFILSELGMLILFRIYSQVEMSIQGHLTVNCLHLN